MDEAFDCWSRGKNTDDYHLDFDAWWAQYDDGVWMVDMFNAGYSVAFIFVIVLVNTGSLLLTLAGMFEIIISIPLAMFAWMIIGQDTLSILELLGVFLILCIGADDMCAANVATSAPIPSSCAMSCALAASRRAAPHASHPAVASRGTALSSPTHGKRAP